MWSYHELVELSFEVEEKTTRPKQTRIRGLYSFYCYRERKNVKEKEEEEDRKKKLKRKYDVVVW